MMEDNPCESVGNNVDGTRVIADLAVKYGTRKFVMIPIPRHHQADVVQGSLRLIYQDQAIRSE